jgi:hypothetical protein
MPDWMVAVGKRTPNGWALSRLTDLLRGELDMAGLATSFVALLAMGVALFLLAGARFRASFAKG